MADAHEELRQVSEQLELVEEQLGALLEQQEQLLRKKKLLQDAIKTAATSVSNNTNWQNEDFVWSSRLKELSESVFKISKFRSLQLETMNATLSGKHCILIMPTGGGKSLCFQLPALISKGVTLVVSPLVSLMEDQLMGLHDLKVDASLLNASSTKEDVKRVHDAMVDQRAPLKLLYVTPEKLAKSKRFMARLEKMYEAGRFARLVIDEVHCCSQWGHDFRPDYKFLGVLRRQFPTVPVLGLTATATSNVVQDARKILQLPDCLVFRASFNRTNLYYEVRPKVGNLKANVDEMQKLINKDFPGKSGIVYCFSQKDTEEVARELQISGVKAACYHGNLDAQHRSRVHKQWMKGFTQVVVATIAFGMGIDKADVRFVIHHSLSKSIENYYQESGRAGRDDKPASCVLYVSYADVFRQSTMVFTEQTGLENLYGMVAYAFNLKICRRALVARHFGERWDSTLCNKMCDHCSQTDRTETVQRDVAPFCQDLLALLAHAKRKDQRLTALKLLDAWMGRGSPALRLTTTKAHKLSRGECERVIVELLLRRCLKEDFHFTPYTTISYLVPGPAAALLESSSSKIEMDFAVSKNTKPATSTSTKPASDTKTKKLVVINHENSKFTTQLMPITSPNDTNTRKQQSRKRKPIVVSDNDDDFEELNFGDQDCLGVLTKKPKSLLTEKLVVIDDSNDSDKSGSADVRTEDLVVQ